MTLACIGYGALIWNPAPLPLRHDRWSANGPGLPVEFARQSSDGRLTLAIVPGAPFVSTYWNGFDHDDFHQAIGQLARREGTADRLEYIGYLLDGGKGYSRFGDTVLEPVREWMGISGVTGAVWTELAWGWRDANHQIPEEAPVPSLESVLAYLSGLEGGVLDRAREYIQKAPRQTQTPYRQAIERRMGWPCLAEY